MILAQNYCKSGFTFVKGVVVYPDILPLLMLFEIWMIAYLLVVFTRPSQEQRRFIMVLLRFVIDFQVTVPGDNIY